MRTCYAGSDASCRRHFSLISTGGLRVSMIRTPEHQRLADSLARRADWKRWGPYVGRARLGNRPGRLQCHGRRLVVLPPRPRPQPGLSLERGRPGGLLQPVPEPLHGPWPSGTSATRSSRSGSSASTGHEGNHGEDVKEYYFYLDATPTHSYMKMLYKYPQVEYPYARLVEESRRRSREARREFELFDAIGDAFRSGRYFDVFIEYAKAAQEDILCRITAVNRGPEAAALARPAASLVPQLLVVGILDRSARGWRSRPTRPIAGSCTSTWASGGWYVDVRPRPPGSCSPRTRRTSSGSSACPIAGPLREGRLPRGRHRTAATTASTRTGRDQGRGALPGGRRAGRDRAVVRTRFADRPLERPFHGFRRDLRPAAARGRRVLRRPCTGPA